VVNETLDVTVVGQAPDDDLKFGPHGSVIVLADAANELITGGWFGRMAGSRALR
jgi:hypothetical protein